MRVGIDCRALQEPFPSGVSVYTRELLRALFDLPEASRHTFVLFVNGVHLGDGIMQLQKEWADAPIEWRVRRMPNKLLTLAHMVSGTPSLQWMFGKVDAVFVPNVQFFPWRDKSVPFVMTVHDLSFERYRDCLSMKGRMRHRLIRPRKMIRAAAHVVAVSSHTAGDMEALYRTAPDKIETIYPGLNPRVLESKTAKELPKRYILSLATIEPRKNIEALLDAFVLVRKKNPDVELVVAGSAGWKSARTIERLHATEGVHYFGYVDEAFKQQLLDQATAFVYPSVYEGFGFPPLEAQESGVPVLVGNHSSLPEVLGNSALYADVMDIDSLARGMSHLLTDAALRDRLIQEGHNNTQRFQWSTSARHLLQLLEQL